MRLNSALISTFLFVSGVLADYYPEKQQPPLLDHVEKSIHNATVLIPQEMFGGAMWSPIPTQPPNLIKFVAGTFTVPSIVKSHVGAGLNIALGIAAKDPNHLVFGVGITVIVDELGDELEVFCYAWGTLYPTTVHAPDWFGISVGDVIGVVVQYEFQTQGVIALINLTTEDVWGVAILGSHIVIPTDAEWVITPLDPTPVEVPVAPFASVTFTILESEILGGRFAKVPEVEGFQELVLKQHNIEITHTMIEPGFLVIQYIGPNTPIVSSR